MDDFRSLNWSANQRSATPNKNSNAFSLNNASNSTSSGQNRSGNSHDRSQQQQQSKGDPFGSLVSFTTGSAASAADQSKLTLRERQQLQQKQQAQLSSGSNSSTGNGGAASLSGDLWNFDALERASTPLSRSRTPQHAMNPDTVDFDPLSDVQNKQTARNQYTTPGNSALESEFDSLSNSPINVGRRENKSSLLDDDEPIPMDPDPPRMPQNQQSQGTDRDFEIAQIVEYGFSAEQAREALNIAGNTREAVLLLREQRSAERQISRSATAASSDRQIHRSDQKTYRDDSDSDSSNDGGFYYDQENSQVGGSRRTGGTRAGSNLQKSSFGGIGNGDRIMATANEIGTSVWKQASAWFDMGKKKINEIQMTMQEQRINRQREMTDRRAWEDDGGAPTSSYQRYRDDSSSDEEVYVSSRRRVPARNQPPAVPSKPERLKPAPQSAREIDEPIIDFGDNIGSSTIQPQATVFQRKPSPSNIPTTAPSTHRQQQAAQSNRGYASNRADSTPTRSTATVSVPNIPPNILTASNASKVQANEKFKLGQFGDAINGYTDAISRLCSISDSHPLLILYYNNRALAYSRNGESKNSISDCTRTLELCDLYKNNGVITLENSDRIDLVEQSAKSLQRRADAHEANEKYTQALEDWKALRDIARDPTTRKQSVDGVKRCEKALGINQPEKKLKKPEPKPKSEDLANVFASISISNVKSGKGLNSHVEKSVAVNEMRKQEQAKRDEDAQRLELNDQVDAELKQWRDGKQQNLRALLSSLHTLLPEFKKIEMHDILEPNKTKRAYMRAIAKLHPDKLDKELDVRRKMISANVFSTLNEAWDTFKSQNGIS